MSKGNVKNVGTDLVVTCCWFDRILFWGGSSTCDGIDNILSINIERHWLSGSMCLKENRSTISISIISSDIQLRKYSEDWRSVYLLEYHVDRNVGTDLAVTCCWFDCILFWGGRSTCDGIINILSINKERH